MIQTLRCFPFLKPARRYAALCVLMVSASVASAADGDAELSVNGVTTTITDTEVFTGELYPLTAGDVGYESTAHRNAVVVTGGGELKLSSGADVWVKNDDDHTTFLRVGYGSGTAGNGTLTIESGALLRVGSSSRYANFQLGQGTGVTGTVNQTGGDMTLIGSLNVGVNGGTGAYNISGGTLTFDNAGAGAANQVTLVSVGFNNSIASAGTSAGQFNISGGLVEVNASHDGGYSSFIIGNRAINALQAYSGTGTNSGNAGPGNGVVTQTGGTFRIGAGGTLYLSAYGNGTYNLNGGTLEVGGTGLQAQYGNAGGFTNTLNLGGGTIRTIGTVLGAGVNATLSASTTSTIDTNGIGTTWTGALTGSGNLTKIGDGTLTLSNAANSFGILNAQAGTTTVTSGSTTVTRLLAGVSGGGGGGTFVLGGGTLNVSGPNETYIGSGSGNTGALTIGGGTLNLGLASTPSTRVDFIVGSFGGTGTATQTNGTVVMNSTGGLFHIGNQGTGTYNLSGGTFTTQNSVILGRTTAGGTGNGSLNISGGTLTLASATNGKLIVGGVDGTGNLPGTGTVTQTGGTVTIGKYIELGTAGGAGTYNLNGGTLEVGGASGIHASTGTANFNLGGGTLKVVGSDLGASVDATLTGGTTSTINTNGLNATWSGNLAGAGLHQIDFGGSSLVKTGTGTLTFSGASRVLDTFAVTGGTIAQTAGATSAVEFMVGSGTGTTGSYVMSGGTLTINPSTRTDNTTAVAGSFRVGDFGGTGTFTQNAGTITVSDNGALNVGNQGGTGTYNLTGGTLSLNAGNHVIGRSTSGKPASTGTLNVSGGTLVIDNGGHLILGNNIEDAGTNFGAGTLTQTGGTIRITDGGLYVGASGNGTYNLFGGTLEVAGAGLLGRYGSGAAAGVSTFNFGMGTIKVIDSDLTTSLNANLVGGILSTIDTNGFNATWSGNLTGTGTHQVDAGGNALAKIGAGTLYLSGATRTLDTFAAAGGTTRQTTGATTVGEFMVGTAAGSTATFEMAGGTLFVDSSLAANNTTQVAGSFRVGDFTGTGTFTQTGGTVTVGTADHDAALNIGNQGGNGTYNLSGGTLRISGGNSVIGRSTGANGTSTGVLNISGAGTLLELTDGSALINGNNTFGRTDGSATITQTGGTVRVTSGALYVAGYSAGTYNFSGGTLEAGGSSSLKARYNTSTATSTFNFGGGTIKVVGSNLTTDILATLVSGSTSTVNTNGFDATFTGTLTGAGLHTATYGGNTFAKTGTGTLTLTGATRVFDTFNVAVGTARQTAGTTTALELKTGAGATTAYEMAGGTLDIKGSTQVDNTTAIAGALVIGDAGGSGTFTQTAGTVTVGSSGDGELLIGREGGNGAYALSGGTLKLSGGQSVLSRSNATHAASAASLDLSGAGTLLELINGASLVIGNDMSSGGATGSATLTQTGGTLRVTDGTLYVAGYGAGTYNLNGGTLEVGGDGLAARYGTSVAASTFNFGTATLKVIGSNLVTDVHAVLANSAVSTINTNGFNATLSGTITGQGGLTKTGAGTLFLTGASDYSGATTVSTGTLRVDGTLANTGISVASGATFSGHGTVHDLTILGGGNLVQGGTTGALSVTGDLTLAATSYTLLGLAGDSSYDTITVDGTLFAGGVLDVQTLNAYDPLTGATFDLFDGTFSGTFAEVRLPTLVSGLEWNTDNLYTSGVIAVVTSPIPEPATWAAILGAVALGAGFCRRRRRSEG